MGILMTSHEHHVHVIPCCNQKTTGTQTYNILKCLVDQGELHYGYSNDIT